MTNQIQVIKPERKNGLWVFTDPKTGLVDEPFVAGADVLIDIMVIDIPDAKAGFNLVFSHEWFPDHDHVFERMYQDGGGYWYKHQRSALHGWLCPAMFHYFEKAPEKIYVKCNPAE